MGKVITRAILLCLTTLLAFVTGALLWLWTSVPPESGLITVAAITAPVTISRDEFGLPTIRAQDDRDAAFALGFVHAQDRLFQMDLMRRFGNGRLSEWFGIATLGSDRFVRTLGVPRAARRQYPLLSGSFRQVLDAYAAGVNAYEAQRTGPLPPEYYVLNVGWEPWRAEDTLVWGKLIDLELTGNFRDEILRSRLLQRLTPDELAVLFPPYPSLAPVVLPETRALLQQLPLDRLYADLPARLGPFEASNNWVLSGIHTANGKPLLANDPHLGFSEPGTWYLARIETPTSRLTGASVPGTPLVLIGHNQQVAWGVTATRSDVEDLFIERVDAADGDRYITPDGPRAFDVREEEIRVKGRPPVSLRIRETRHGPVISDLGGYAKNISSPGQVLSMQATWLEDGDASPEAIWNMTRSRNWSEFSAALERLTAPQQNFVYADVDGNIGFLAPGRIPIRRKGDGWLPVPGWSGEYDWIGFIPFSALPKSLNPTTGFFVTANNKIVSNGYPYFLSRDWIAPYRAERIGELLVKKEKQTPEDMLGIQMDVQSLAARQLLPLLLQTRTAEPLSGAMLERLRAWNGRMERDKIEPLIFVAWLRELGRTLLQAKLDAAFNDYWDLRPEVLYSILTEHSDWCDDAATLELELCGSQLTRSLTLAGEDLTRRFGSDMSLWTWGRGHHAIFAHQLWSHTPVLKELLDLRVPADGGTDTINNAVVSVRNEAAPFDSSFGSTLRMIVDMSNPPRARFMIAPGQSGNPFSSHFSDLLSPWRNGGMIDFEGGSIRNVIKLLPKNSN